MDERASKRLRDFLEEHLGHSELLLALVPMVSGQSAWKIIGLLRELRLPSHLRPLQERVARAAYPDGEEWHRLQTEVRENLKSSFSKDFWDLVEQIPPLQCAVVIRDFLDHHWEDPPTGIDQRRGLEFSVTRSGRRGIDRDRGEPESKPAGRTTRGRGAPQKPPSRERRVQSGFAPISTPGGYVDQKEPLSAETRYFYWLEIGGEVAGAIETQRVDLPEDVPLGATIEVVLFSFPGGIEIEPGADVGVLRLLKGGVVEVERQPGGEEREIRNRLLFPIKTPKDAGIARLRCNLYYKQVLVVSLQVEAVVAGRTRAMPPVLDQEGRRLRSTPDYVLSHDLAPAHLSQLGEHRFSLMINGDGATHDFRFFGADGAEWVKNDIHVEAVALQNEIRLGREALRMAAWGEISDWSLDWDPETKYRYNRPRAPRDMAADLARLAIAGYRLYNQLVKSLARTEQEAFERTTLASGLVQVALKESAALVWPAAILYDIPLDSNAFPVEKYRLCETFEAALAGSAPLEECACFHGGCAHRQRLVGVFAEGRLTEEAGAVICPSGFWGFRHALGLPVSVAGAPDAPGRISFQGAPRVAIGVSTDPKLRLREAHEAALRKLRADLGWERGTTRAEVLRMLKATKAQIVYFYCHGGVTSSRIPYVEVGYNESGITPDNLSGNKIVWKEPRPLVFINGCHTTALAPEDAINLVSAFVEDSAAAGVIGTEITVFERLACDFAEACLQRFLNGAKLGEAVRGARLELLRRGNPLGLAYIPFALASLDLVEKTGGS